MCADLYPRNVDRCCTRWERAVEGALILSLESQRGFHNLLFSCLSIEQITKWLIPWETVNFVSLESQLKRWDSRETKFAVLLRDQSFGVNLSLDLSKGHQPSQCDVVGLNRNFIHLFHEKKPFNRIDILWTAKRLSNIELESRQPIKILKLKDSLLVKSKLYKRQL